MRRLLIIVMCLLGTTRSSAHELTALERSWLRASEPVLDYAKAAGLPLEVVFDFAPQAGEPPLSLGYERRRCQLVFALRGNAEAEAATADVEPDLQGIVVEAMAAHELAHCWRHAKGAWNEFPVSFSETRLHPGADPSLRRLREDVRRARGEEAFADLAALAWTAWRHPEAYRRVHAWLCAVRGHGTLPGTPHDTLAWIQLARDQDVFQAAATPFQEALPLWEQGMRQRVEH